jgi:hypothetical protein
MFGAGGFGDLQRFIDLKHEVDYAERVLLSEEGGVSVSMGGKLKVRSTDGRLLGHDSFPCLDRALDSAGRRRHDESIREAVGMLKAEMAEIAATGFCDEQLKMLTDAVAAAKTW